jgi:hypothetical protein
MARTSLGNECNDDGSEAERAALAPLSSLWGSITRCSYEVLECLGIPGQYKHASSGADVTRAGVASVWVGPQ